MTLEEFNYLSEIIASVAVIASLLYLALEVRQNTAATQASSRVAWVDTLNEVVGLISSAPNLADILHRGANGLSNLKDSEILQFSAWLDQNFIMYETYYFQWKAGVLDARLWSIYRRAIASFLVQAGQQQWWETRRDWFDQEFQQYVNEVMETEKAKPMHPFSVEPSGAT